MSRRWADTAFEDFWAIYPRKVGKLAAKRAWDKIRPTPEIVEAMAKALEWQCPEWDDPQFIPHPASWLNAGRWMDEPSLPMVPKHETPKNLVGLQAWANRKQAANE